MMAQGSVCSRRYRWRQPRVFAITTWFTIWATIPVRGSRTQEATWLNIAALNGTLTRDAS